MGIKNAQRVKITSGTYTGDSTANRAIPHGGRTIPKMVIWTIVATTCFEHASHNGFIMCLQTATENAVTAMDSTNFYVGNAAHYDQSVNQNAIVYYWTAFF